MSFQKVTHPWDRQKTLALSPTEGWKPFETEASSLRSKKALSMRAIVDALPTCFVCQRMISLTQSPQVASRCATSPVQARACTPARTYRHFRTLEANPHPTPEPNFSALVNPCMQLEL